MSIEFIVLSIGLIISIGLSSFTIVLLRKKTQKKFFNDINKLEIKKNELNSLPVTLEINKIEDIAKSEQLEEKLADFKVRYKEVKEVKLARIDDLISELDESIEQRNYREYISTYSEIEMELDEADYALHNIMTQIEEIASYEDKYRNIVIKLKNKYRFLEHCYTEKEQMFRDYKDSVKMQFENIAKRFKDFDTVMDEKLYNEVILVVNSLDAMIDNLDVIIKELPDIILLLEDLIPGRINDLNNEYFKMVEEGYPLKYLNLESNLLDIEKKENDIATRAKVLNITDSLFDLRTILEYLDSLFKDLDEEKKAKEKFDKLEEAYNNKEVKLNKIVRDIYDELDDIKALYHLNEKDLDIIDKLNLKLSVIIKEHKKLLREIKKQNDSYKKHNITINDLMGRINGVSLEFEEALHTLGSFYEDEMRAHEELKNMHELLKKCREKVRNAHLPIIYDNYFVEVEEACDAIKEVEHEIENKPIVIKKLNMRVETARDLTFKLYDTVNKMIKYANFSEMLIVYGNRYREKENIEKGLSKAELLYFSGNYEEAFNSLLKVIKSVDEELIVKIKKLLKN